MLEPKADPVPGAVIGVHSFTVLAEEHTAGCLLVVVAHVPVVFHPVTDKAIVFVALHRPLLSRRSLIALYSVSERDAVSLSVCR
jgi:hypothetical protein